MKMKLALIVFAIAITIARAADKPTDLTGADASSFKSHLGQIVSLSGRLEDGMRGLCLFNATPTNVVFYVIPDPSSGSYAYPDSWTRLVHKRVQVTGELKFRSFDHSKAGPFDQIPPDYYYIVLQKASIEPAEPK
jgi:hypothetical protein